jgi:hypothetical protein
VPDEALYFPYMEVPRRPELTRVLLYWDRLATIVPGGVGQSRHLRELIDADLVRPLDPKQHESPPEDWILQRIEDIARTARGTPNARIHYSKASSWLWDRLQGRGLAQRDPGDPTGCFCQNRQRRRIWPISPYGSGVGLTGHP